MSTILSAAKGVQRNRIVRIGHLHVRSVGASHKLDNHKNSALRTPLHGSRCVKRCKPIFASVSSVDDVVAEEPPHHTDDIPDTPGSPARLLTDVFIAVNVVVFVAQLVSPEVTILGVKDNDFINQGEYWRLLTAAFLHGSPIHLILNCSSLASLGPIVEWTCGRERFIIIYLLAAISGNLASYFGSEYSSLGASGAVFGLSGALAVYFLRNKTLFGGQYNGLIVRLFIIIILNLGIGHFLPQIDEWGHIGGLLGGAAVAYLLGPRYELCRIKGYEGVWVVDEPPIDLPFVPTMPPRKILK